MAVRTKSKNTEKVWKTAAYIRLSREDNELRSGDKLVSESVVNQQQLIEEFIKKQADLGDYSTFIDDGLTGTNFNREGFQSMMAEIKSGNINCVVVKDLSRFGRNYTEAGMYMEEVFPMFGVRFIAINDNIDSYLRPSEMDSILVPIKNLLNDSYSRDLSVKIKSALTTKRSRGEFIGSMPAYGFKRDPEDKNKLIIDTEVADHVRDMFEWYAQGMSKDGIVKRLNAMHIPSPAKYRIMNYPPKKKYNTEHYKDFLGLWNIHTMGILLTNPVYCGHLAQGKRTTVNYKNTKQVLIPKEDWIIVENTHEGIVSQELFDKVQALLKQNSRTAPNKDTVYLLSGFLRCGDCHRFMTRSSSRGRNGVLNGFYRCSTRMRQSKDACTTHHISEKLLTESVLKAIQTQIALFLETDALVKSLDTGKRRASQLAGIGREIASFERQIAETEQLKMGLYADLKRELLSEDEYISLKSCYLKQLGEYQQNIAELQLEMQRLDEQEQLQNVWAEKFQQNKNIDTLTRDVLTELVEKIDVYENKRISIVFKFQDEFERMLRYLKDEQQPKLNTAS